MVTQASDFYFVVRVAILLIRFLAVFGIEGKPVCGTRIDDSTVVSVHSYLKCTDNLYI